MIIELRKKSQITLPKEIVKNLNLQEGDRFEVSIENGSIKLEPVAVYSLSDPEMRNPLPVKPIITKEKFTGPGKISDLNRYVKRAEWSSFDRRSLIE